MTTATLDFRHRIRANSGSDAISCERPEVGNGPNVAQMPEAPVGRFGRSIATKVPAYERPVGIDENLFSNQLAQALRLNVAIGFRR